MLRSSGNILIMLCLIARMWFFEAFWNFQTLAVHSHLLIIGHVNMGIIFYCIGNSQWWIYDTQSKSVRLLNIQSTVLQADWLKLMSRQHWTLTCPIGREINFELDAGLWFGMYFYASFADRLGVDFRYTFNFSKPEDKHVTHINLQSKPRHDDRDVELTITCYEPARLNLTLYSSN